MSDITWEIDELEHLMKYIYRKITLAEVCTLLPNKKRSLIVSRASYLRRRAGVSRRRPLDWTDEMVSELMDSNNLTKFAKKYGMSFRSALDKKKELRES